MQFRSHVVLEKKPRRTGAGAPQTRAPEAGKSLTALPLTARRPAKVTLAKAAAVPAARAVSIPIPTLLAPPANRSLQNAVKNRDSAAVTPCLWKRQ
jgi:hypothetical protein